MPQLAACSDGEPRQMWTTRLGSFVETGLQAVMETRLEMMSQHYLGKNVPG